MPSARTASRSAGSAVAPLTTNPPLAPTGTITAFFTICAFISPRTSVRKSSGRSLHRRPPRAIGPPRRWTPSTYGEHTKISNCGRGSGRNEMSLGRSFTAISSRSARGTEAFVRSGGVDQGQERPADPVLVERRHRVETFEERPVLMCIRRGCARRRRSLPTRRVETSVEQFDEQAGDRRLSHERLLDVLRAESEPDLAEVAAVEPEDADLVGSSPPSRMRRFSPSDSIVPVTSPTNARWSSIRCELVDVVPARRARRSRRATPGRRRCRT